MSVHATTSTSPTLTSTPAYPDVVRQDVALDVAGATHIGHRRSRNEDAYLIATLQRSIVVHEASPDTARGSFAGQTAGKLLVVADGMGGEGGGDLASRVAVQTIASYLLNVMPWVTARTPPTPNARRESSSLPGVRDQLSSALVVGDSTVKTAGAQHGSPGMGTTLTMAFIAWPVLYVAHVGDSRCYLFRSGTLSRLTTDHTVAQQMLDEGIRTADPESQWHHVLWNSLGGSEQIPKPEIAKLELAPGDTVLLCSDGLTKHIGDDEIAATLGAHQTSAALCARLIERANAEGGTDNVTVVIASAEPRSTS